METRHSTVEHPHPQPLEYIKIAVVLSIITIIEVAIILPELPIKVFMGPLVVPTLIVLSVVKFAMVAMWYMHLKFDDRLFSGLFVGGIALAAGVVIALLTLFRVFFA
jgi:cytochrome c oxidase subunit IV